MDNVMVYIYGNPEDEHSTKLVKNDKEIRFYCDGYEGVSSNEILELLQVLDINPFIIIKE